MDIKITVWLFSHSFFKDDDTHTCMNIYTHGQTHKCVHTYVCVCVHIVFNLSKYDFWTMRANTGEPCHVEIWESTAKKRVKVKSLIKNRESILTLVKKSWKLHKTDSIAKLLHGLPNSLELRRNLMFKETNSKWDAIINHFGNLSTDQNGKYRNTTVL